MDYIYAQLTGHEVKATDDYLEVGSLLFNREILYLFSQGGNLMGIASVTSEI